VRAAPTARILAEATREPDEEIDMTDVQQRTQDTPARYVEPSDWLSRWLDWPARLFPELARATNESRLPRVEEFLDGNEVVVRAELPGIDPERNVEITVSDQTLRIRAERRQESKGDDKNGYRSEFVYGLFERVIPLPAGVNEDDVKATYREGILEVRVPIDERRAEAKRIPVQRG
jgi:HSP20 family protein